MYAFLILFLFGAREEIIVLKSEASQEALLVMIVLVLYSDFVIYNRSKSLNTLDMFLCITVSLSLRLSRELQVLIEFMIYSDFLIYNQSGSLSMLEILSITFYQGYYYN